MTQMTTGAETLQGTERQQRHFDALYDPLIELYGDFSNISPDAWAAMLRTYQLRTGVVLQAGATALNTTAYTETVAGYTHLLEL